MIIKSFIVAGTSFCKNAIESIAPEKLLWDLTASEMKEEFEDGDKLFRYESDLGEATLIPEPENEYDPNAIRVEIKGKKVGYIKKGSTSEVRNLLAKGDYYIQAELFGGPYIEFEEDDDGELHLNRGSYEFKITLHFRDQKPVEVLGSTQAPVSKVEEKAEVKTPEAPKEEPKKNKKQTLMLILAILCTLGIFVIGGFWRVIYIVLAGLCWFSWFKMRKSGGKT